MSIEANRERKALYIAEITKAMYARRTKRLDETLSPQELGELNSGDRITALLKHGLLDNLRVIYATHRQMDVLPGVLAFVHIFSDRGSGSCTYSIPKMAKFLSRSENSIREALRRGVADGVLARIAPAAGHGYSHWPVVFRSILDPSSSPTWFVDAALSSDDEPPQDSLGGDGGPSQLGGNPSTQLEGGAQDSLGGPLKTACNVYSREKLDSSSREKATPKPQTASGAKKRNSYPEDFEAFWKAYPSTANNSKPKAFAEWKRLSAEDRVAASVSLTAYDRFLRKEREKRRGEPHPVLHAERYLRTARFEGFADEIEAERHNAWKRAIIAYMLGDDWNAPKWKAGGPAPGTAGFPMSIEQVRSLVKSQPDWSTQLSAYERGAATAEEGFNLVRPEMFEEGERERIEANRKAALEHKRQVDEEESKRQAQQVRAEKLLEEGSEIADVASETDLPPKTVRDLAREVRKRKEEQAQQAQGKLRKRKLLRWQLEQQDARLQELQPGDWRVRQVHIEKHRLQEELNRIGA